MWNFQQQRSQIKDHSSQILNKSLHIFVFSFHLHISFIKYLKYANNTYWLFVQKLNELSSTRIDCRENVLKYAEKNTIYIYILVTWKSGKVLQDARCKILVHQPWNKFSTLGSEAIVVVRETNIE